MADVDYAVCGHSQSPEDTMVGVSARTEGRRPYAVVAAAVLVAAVVAGVMLASRRARIDGETPEERIESICKLADKQPWGAGDVLAKAAVRESNDAVRQTALIGLARFTNARYRPVIEQCARDASVTVRAAAATTLGLYQDEAAADLLGKIAGSDQDPKARIAAVIGLGRNKTHKSIVWLVETAEGDRNSKVQVRAMRELYKKLDMRYVGAGPARKDLWLDNLEFVKGFDRVQEAFRLASRPLQRRPEHLRTHSEPEPNVPADE